MTDRELTILLDTNVLLDEYLPDRPCSPVSRKLIDRVYKRGDHLLFCPHALVDVHYQIAATFKKMVRAEKGELTQADALAIQEIAWGCIDNVCEWATSAGSAQSDVWLARKYKQLNRDFEDNVLLAAAERSNVDYLVTSDRQLLQKATVAALSPEDMLAVLDARE